MLVEGPFGSSYLREHHTGQIMCIAGGSGLVPIKAIVEAVIARGMKQVIDVYFGARSRPDLYLIEYFEWLTQRHLRLRFIPVLSDPSTHGAWRTGLVTDIVASDLQDLDGWNAMSQGHPTTVEAAMQIATARGLLPTDLHADVFFTPELASTRK